MATPGDVGHRSQFRQRIHRPHLGRLRQAEHVRLGIMNVRALVHRAVNGLRIDLSVRPRQQQNLGAISKELRRAALGGFDVRLLVAQNAVVGLA